MQNLLKTTAFVLSSKILPSTDVIYTFLTQDNGKVRIYAKGIKKITSKRKPHLQTGNLVTAVIRKHADHYYLQETTLISSFSQVKLSHEKLNWLYSYLYLVDRLLPEMEPEVDIFNILKKLLIDLSKNDNAPELFLKSANDTLVKLGYTSEFNSLSEIKELFTKLTGQNLPFYTI